MGVGHDVFGRHGNWRRGRAARPQAVQDDEARLGSAAEAEESERVSRGPVGCRRLVSATAAAYRASYSSQTQPLPGAQKMTETRQKPAQSL